MTILYCGGMSTQQTRTNVDWNSQGVPIGNEFSESFRTETYPQPNNMALDVGSNVIARTFGYPAVGYPYMSFLGKTMANDAATNTRCIRFYGMFSDGANRGIERTGKWIVGVRVTRLGGSATSGPLVWTRMDSSEPTGVNWYASATTSARGVYVEVVADWTVKKLFIYYDGTLVTTKTFGSSGEIYELMVGSRYMQNAGTGSYLPSVLADTSIEFSDIYVVWDKPDDPAPTGRLGAIRIEYGLVGEGTDWEEGLKSTGGSAVAPPLTSAEPKTVDMTPTAPKPEYDIVGVVTETIARRNDPSTATTLKLTTSSGDTSHSASTPLVSSLQRFQDTMAVPANFDINTVKVKFEASA
jgi:hypothetical protein